MFNCIVSLGMVAAVDQLHTGEKSNVDEKEEALEATNSFF
jgi:hypothetical protein